MQNPRAKGLSRFISAALVLAMVLAALPPFELPVFAAGQTHTFDSGAVYIDSSFNGDVVIIKDGVFSVTVNGAQNVELVFGERTATGTKGVTIDRRPDADINNAKVDDKVIRANKIGNNENATLYTISQQLASVYGNNATGKAQTCPLLITGNSTVTATFHGKCRFYAGTNASTVGTDGKYNPQHRYNNNYGNGFAGIQVDSGSTFTIVGAEDLKVFGSHQFGIPGDDGMATINGYTVKYSEVLRANASIGDHTNPGIGQYVGPDTATHHNYSGGAGIGGGATLITTSSGTSSFTNGTPGNIIINGGNIEVYGGHQAAGIGGAVNSPATSGMIQINGGNIVVHGGRWSAGIGDGDSVANNISSQFSNVSSLIEINGGNVEVYGGVASSGIGTTDEISDSKGVNATFVRDMHINLNGGVIRAYSGFPDNFNGNSYPTEAPAAIGAGGKSLTPANSVYVSADADLRSAGFGNYALTEDGKNANTVPTIAVDSDGYLLLLRTSENNSSGSDQFHSTENRTLTLYSPIKVEFLDETWTVYIDQQHNKRYLVNDEGIVYEENASGTDSAYGSNWKIVESGALPSTLTLYINAETVDGAASKFYDADFPASTVLETVEMAYYFRSIALTLPHPEEHGGIYALGIPINGIDASDIKDENGNVIRNPQFDQISLTVEATQQGTQSGWIDFPSGHNMQKDSTAAPFTDLDVDGNATIDGLIGNRFNPNTYAYTVYAEPGTTEVDIYFAFEQQKNTNGNNISHKIDFNGTILRNGTTGETTFNRTVKLEEKETVIRIKKTDANNSLGTISYKITIIVKDDYTLALSNPTKVYDGQPAEVTAVAVGIAQGGTGEKREIKEATQEKPENEIVYPTVDPNKTPQVYNSSVYISRYRSWFLASWTYGAANLSYTLEFAHSSDYVYYFLKLSAPTSANSTSITLEDKAYAAGWKVSITNPGNPERLTSSDDTPFTWQGTTYTWVGNNTSSNYASIKLAEYNDVELTLRVSSSGAELFRDNTSVGALLTIATPSNSPTSENTKTTAYNDAEAAAKAGERDPNVKFPYIVSTTSQYTQNITVGTFTWRQDTETTTPGSVTTPYNLGSTKSYTEKGYYYIEYTPPSGGVTVTPVDIPEGDLEKVQYVYYQTKDPYGQPLKDNNGNAIEKRKLDDGEIPVDAGTYYVEATLVTQTYNAAGRTDFKISQRPVEVLRITNWLAYVTTMPTIGMVGTAGNEDLFKIGETVAKLISDIGEAELSNIVAGDEDYVKFVLPKDIGKAYYYDVGSTIAVDYQPDKIVLAQGVLQGNEAHNYYLEYASDEDENNGIIRVYGQLAYYTNSNDGSMFRLDEIGNSWDKYFPVDGDIRVGADGNPADYHSPVYYAHAEYIRARTVNKGENEARYCIDIEYGAMSFGFFRSVWDVNGLNYIELQTSTWSGMDGSNNKLTITNYSNRAITYTLSLERENGVNGAQLGFEIRTTNDQTGKVLVDLTDYNDKSATATGDGIVTVGAASPGNPAEGQNGTAGTNSCYLIMSGIPQIPEGVVTTTGTIGILFKAADDTP